MRRMREDKGEMRRKRRRRRRRRRQRKAAGREGHF